MQTTWLRLRPWLPISPAFACNLAKAEAHKIESVTSVQALRVTAKPQGHWLCLLAQGHAPPLPCAAAAAAPGSVVDLWAAHANSGGVDPDKVRPLTPIAQRMGCLSLQHLPRRTSAHAIMSPLRGRVGMLLCCVTAPIKIKLSGRSGHIQSAVSWLAGAR